VITGIVLAGGRSERFGSDKLAALVDGVPLLHRAILAVAAVTDEVLVVAAPDGAPPLPVIDRPVRLVRDREPAGGPLAALAGSLEAARGEVSMVVGGDMPSLVPAVLVALIGALAPHRNAAVLLDGERQRPLPLAVRTEAAREAAHALRADGVGRLRALLEALDARGIPENDWRALDPEGASLVDVDRPEDLDAIRHA
jgi:molybdopterin-guanine dinucleotide biosynthesis protein A